MSIPEIRRLIQRMIAINIANALAYRGDYVFYMLSVVLSPLISVMIWRAAVESGAQLPVDETYITSYFVLLGVVSMLTSAWLSQFLADKIRSGELSVWLARPGSFLYELAANNVAEKSFKLVVLAPMIALFGWFFRDSIDLAAPAWRWGVLILSVVLGAVLFFSLDVVEGSLAFWIEDVSGIVRARHLVMLVLAGQLVPLAIMPEWAQGFIAVQPFRFLLSFPLEVIVGDLSGADVALGLLLQAGYAAGFVLLARWVWARGKRSYTAVGA